MRRLMQISRCTMATFTNFRSDNCI